MCADKVTLKDNSKETPRCSMTHRLLFINTKLSYCITVMY